MKTLFLLLGFLCCSQLYAQHTLQLDPDAPKPKASIEDVAWIAGHWKGEAFGGITEEIWSPPMGNSMMCVFRLVKDGVVNFYEIVTITEEQGSLILRLKHFNADLSGWEEKDETVDFPLVKLQHNNAFFDGFTFEKINDEAMNIYVVIGQKDGVPEEMKFVYHLAD